MYLHVYTNAMTTYVFINIHAHTHEHTCTHTHKLYTQVQFCDKHYDEFIYNLLFCKAVPSVSHSQINMHTHTQTHRETFIQNMQFNICYLPFVVCNGAADSKLTMHFVVIFGFSAIRLLLINMLLYCFLMIILAYYNVFQSTQFFY